MIKEIAHFIAARAGAGFAVGTTIQVGHRTDASPDQCSVVLESAGGALHFDLPDRNDKMVQVISRATTYMTARADAWTIFNALHGQAGWKTDLTAIAPATQNYEAMTIEALADPQYIGQDDKDRYEFSTNYIFRIQNA